MTWVALLRGINVGGHKKALMADLRVLVEGLGFADVATYVRSGNLVFDTGGDETEDDLVAVLEQVIESEFGFAVPVIVRSATEISRIGSAHPLDEGGTDPRFLLVGFLDAVPEVDIDEVLDPADLTPDHWELHGRELYLAYPDGSGRSKLTHSLIERRLSVRCTTRNWRTVGELVRLSDR